MIDRLANARHGKRLADPGFDQLQHRRFRDQHTADIHAHVGNGPPQVIGDVGVGGHDVAEQHDRQEQDAQRS